MRNFLLFSICSLVSNVSFPQYAHKWTHVFGETYDNLLYCSWVDLNGNVLITTDVFTDFDLDPDTASFVSTGILNIPNGVNLVTAKYDSAGNYLWHRRSIISGTTLISELRTDNAGNVFIAGYFNGTAYIDNGGGVFDTIQANSSMGYNDIVFLKYSPTGILLFVKHLDSDGSHLHDMFIDNSGSVFITGTYYGGFIDFDPGLGTNIQTGAYQPTFFAKYDSNGNYVFANHYPGTAWNQIAQLHRIKTDNLGNIIIIGPNGGTIDFGGGPTTPGLMLLKYDTLGNYIYHKQIGSSFIYRSLFIDSGNNIYIGGMLENTTDIDPGPGTYLLYGNGSNDAAVVKYDSSGNLEWGRAFGDTGVFVHEMAGDIIGDNSGRIFVKGFFTRRILPDVSFGLPYVSGSNSQSAFLLEFDINGYVVSLKKLLSTGGFVSTRNSLFLSGSNHLYSTGSVYGTADFDLGSGVASRTSSGYSDIFISKYLLKNEHFLISGKVYSDINNDTLFNAGDLPLQNVIVNVNPGNYFASTNASGDYYCYVPQGNYTITIPTPPMHYTVSFPLSDTAVFIPLTSQADTANNFALRPEPNAQDLKIVMTNLGPVRPGFMTTYITSATNVGTVPMPTTTTFDFDSDLIYNTSAPLADTITPYHLAWNVGTLQPSASINLVTEFAVAANLGDTVTTECRIYPDSADLTPFNNKDGLHVIAQGSWDPNYKEAFPSGALLPAQADTTVLTYTIHFQNTGTDTAFTVLLVDTLSDLLNVSTFIVEASSHACSYVISGNGIVEFTFRNILLPDSGTNFIASCGFVKYRIKPLQGLINGMVIENTAHIVFDFNVPVVTNTVQIPIGVLGIGGNDARNSVFNLFPNPVNSTITLSSLNPATNYSIFINDILGNTIITQKHKGSERMSVDVKSLASGIYFIVAETDGVSAVKKFVKQH